MCSVDLFKKDCLELEEDVVVQKHLIDGSSYFFDTFEQDEFQFKKDIARSLNVHIRDIAIVGSGKLGFSLKPDKTYTGYYNFDKFDNAFNTNSQNKKSDLDIAIVSSTLFDQQLVNLFNYTSQYIKVDIWNERTDRNSFAKYILKGWLKPDFIPKGYEISSEINKMANLYEKMFQREINIGIYKSWFFFENYHLNNIQKIKNNIIANV